MVKTRLETLLDAADAAERVYAADPHDDTLGGYVGAWDQVLLELDDTVDVAVQAMAAHHGAVAHLQVFRHHGDEDHADIAADLLRRVQAKAPAAELRFAATADLATLRFNRYLASGGSARLRAAVLALSEAVSTCPEGFEFRPVLVGSLGMALAELARRRSDPSLRNRAVELHEEAVATAADDAPFRSALRINLANALVARYLQEGRLADLDRAEALHQELAALGADGLEVVIARCEVWWERYAITGDSALLDAVITDLRMLAGELPENVPVFATVAGNLANALLERQSRTATANEVLDLLRRGLAATAAGTPERARLHHVLGAAHWQEYVRTGDLSRLDEAITAWQEAVSGLSQGDEARPGYLNSVAVGLLQRHAHHTDPDDLRSAVATARRALRVAPPRAAVRPVLWNTLGHALIARYRLGGRRRDLDAAVDAWERAVELCPREAAVRPTYVASLAGGLRERAAKQKGDAAVADLVTAERLGREATAALEGSLELAGQLTNLGLSLEGLALVTADVEQYREAAATFGRAVTLGLDTSPGEALRAGLAWQSMATALSDWSGAAAAGDGTLSALWTLLARQLFRPAKETWLRTCSGVAATTAYAHGAGGDGRAAAVAFESGRALLTDGALPPSATLGAVRPDLVARYTAATANLAAAVRVAVAGGTVPQPDGFAGGSYR